MRLSWWSISYLLRLPRGISITTKMHPGLGSLLIRPPLIRVSAPRPADQGPCWQRSTGSVAGREFRRIENLPPYVFTIINNLKVEARRAGADVIDLGFANPDIPSPQIAVDKLAE